MADGIRSSPGGCHIAQQPIAGPGGRAPKQLIACLSLGKPFQTGCRRCCCCCCCCATTAHALEAIVVMYAHTCWSSRPASHMHWK